MAINQQCEELGLTAPRTRNQPHLVATHIHWLCGCHVLLVEVHGRWSLVINWGCWESFSRGSFSGCLSVSAPAATTSSWNTWSTYLACNKITIFNDISDETSIHGHSRLHFLIPCNCTPFNPCTKSDGDHNDSRVSIWLGVWGGTHQNKKQKQCISVKLS